jgi:hypothetical protein
MTGWKVGTIPIIIKNLNLNTVVTASYPGALNNYNTWSIQVGRRRAKGLLGRVSQFKCTLPISPFIISPHYNTSCKLVICASLFIYKETPGTRQQLWYLTLNCNR